MNSLRVALANNSPADIDTALSDLRQASDHLNRSLAFYGAVQGRLEDATNFAADYDVQLKTEMSQKQDADTAAAALELSQGSTQLQAALTMRANLPRTSLFDFLG